METSLFIEWVKKNLPGITVAVTNKLNDTKSPLSYLHKRMLRPEFSVTGQWESVSIANKLVMADFVALGSSLPLKKRDSISKASGKIVKMGMELHLNEQQLTDLDTLVATNATDSQILARLFSDTPKVIGGIYERNESAFLEGLSSGIALIEDDENVGLGVRIDYGYKAANKFGVATLWATSATATPMDDIDRVLDAASTNGDVISKVMMDKVAFNNFAKTTQAKEHFAFSAGFVGAKIPVPSQAQINSFTSERYGFNVEVVDRTVTWERNGVQTSYKPWKSGSVVFLTSDIVGQLVYAKTAEENHPVAGVTYQKAEDYILVSKYRKNFPAVSEYTSAQARVVPVISNIDSIYLLDSLTVQA